MAGYSHLEEYHRHLNWAEFRLAAGTVGSRLASRPSVTLRCTTTASDTDHMNGSGLVHELQAYPANPDWVLQSISPCPLSPGV
jgi:hypothetical protein